jgi:hypothetical protein
MEKKLGVCASDLLYQFLPILPMMRENVELNKVLVESGFADRISLVKHKLSELFKLLEEMDHLERSKASGSGSD